MPHNSQFVRSTRGDVGPGILLALLILFMAAGAAGAVLGLVAR